jgi:hypothetical protein
MMSMKNRDLGIVLMAVIAFTHVMSARGQDKVVGVIWQIKFEADNPTDEVVRKFRATPDGKVWNMPDKGKPRVIGKWSGNAEKTKVQVSGAIGFNGKYEFVQIGKDPPSWQGDFEDEDGKKRPIKIRLLKD